MAKNDIDPLSGSRLPLPRREDLDELGQGVYDIVADPTGVTLRGLRGPGGIYLYSSQVAALLRPLNNYLRNQAGFSPRLREIAILAAARACDSQFEWVAHEKESLKLGIPMEVIDVIKHRKPTTGLDETEALVIDLCRESFERRNLSPEVYARALQRFGTKGLVDLAVLMGYYTMMAGVLTVFDMQLDPGQEPLLPIP